MRIEPTSNSQFRPHSYRQHTVDRLSQLRNMDAGNAANHKQTHPSAADTDTKPGTAVVSMNSNTAQTPRNVSSRRWRTHVPFLAQYIGQQTAKETNARAVRRAPEKAQEAYSNRANPGIPSRTMAQV